MQIRAISLNHVIVINVHNGIRINRLGVMGLYTDPLYFLSFLHVETFAINNPSKSLIAG